MRGADESFTYMGYGPFPTQEALARFIATEAAKQDQHYWAVRPISSGAASGWLSLMNIEPHNAAIELGSIWFSPRLAGTRAATEACYLLLNRAAEELGYRRLVWKCNALNAPPSAPHSATASPPKAILRAHMVVKSRSRDTAMFSITAAEWPAIRSAFTAWLAPDNFAPDGSQRRPLAAFRG